MNDVILEATDLTKVYRRGASEVRAVDGWLHCDERSFAVTRRLRIAACQCNRYGDTHHTEFADIAWRFVVPGMTHVGFPLSELV